MIHATLSLPGLYTYDNTVLDNLQLPEALDRETVIDNLLLDTVELELLYPDADMMKQAVGFWSKKRLPIWQKLYDTTVLEYNPIWNVDGTTREERTIDQTRQYSESGSDTRNGSGSEHVTGNAESESDQETTGNTLNKSNTFNSGAMIDNDKSESEGTGRTTASGTTESQTARSDTETGTSEKSGDETGNTQEILETERHGNIGVTTTQQMIREEREVVEFDVIQYIIDDFKSRFCLLVY